MLLPLPSALFRAAASALFAETDCCEIRVSFLLYLAEPSRDYSEGRRVPDDSCILDHVVLSSCQEQQTRSGANEWGTLGAHEQELRP